MHGSMLNLGIGIAIKFTLWISLALLLSSVSSFQNNAQAAEFLSGIEVTVGPNEVYEADVYAFAREIIVDGTIEGDLVAASESIVINGAVNGDLIVAARAISVDGVVEDDIRAAGAELDFESQVGGDVIVAGDRIVIGPDAVIGEDLAASANTLVADGRIEGNVDISAVEAILTGTVQGNVNATIQERLELGPESTIEGTLNYTSQYDATMAPGAAVGGEITQFEPTLTLFGNDYPFSALIQFVIDFIEQVRWFIGTLLMGLLLIWLFPGAMHNLVTTLATSPWKSLFLGVSMFPLTALLLLLSLILVLAIIGFSAFSLVAIPAMIYTALLLLAKPTIAMALGNYIGKHFGKREQPHSRSALAIGAAILAVVGLIPYVSTLAGWLTLLLGFGMWLLYLFRSYREAQALQAI